MKLIKINYSLILLVLISFYPKGIVALPSTETSLETSFTEPQLLESKIRSMTDIGNGVLLQSYYWLVPDNGEWWNIISDYTEEFSEIGFDALWLPPPSKTREGDTARGGYEPYDYYDLGEFDQKGSTRTRYGTRAELKNLIQDASNHDIQTIADIVINHNNGGEEERNIFAGGGNTSTNFMNIASGKFPRNYTCFYPCEYGTSDALQFGVMPDLCHANPYVHDELIKWGEWLRDEIGFTGWRF
ncbi:unnamed protein product, partial [marine sediment metagenome]